MDGKPSQISKMDSKYDIRRAFLDDIPSILKLGEEFTTETGIPEIFNPYFCQKILTHYIPSVDGVCLVLTHNKNVVGFIGGIVQQHMFNPEVVILVEMMWFTSKEYRKTTQNIKLLKEFEKVGITLNASQIYLTLRSNLKADKVEKLYQRMGYIEQERTFTRKI
jgi:hypothetical protein